MPWCVVYRSAHMTTVSKATTDRVKILSYTAHAVEDHLTPQVKELAVAIAADSPPQEAEISHLVAPKRRFRQPAAISTPSKPSPPPKWPAQPFAYAANACAGHLNPMRTPRSRPPII